MTILVEFQEYEESCPTARYEIGSNGLPGAHILGLTSRKPQGADVTQNRMNLYSEVGGNSRKESELSDKVVLKILR